MTTHVRVLESHGDERRLRRHAARSMAKVRVVAVAFVAAQSAVYQPPAGLEPPFAMWTLPAAVAVAALVVTVGGVRAAGAERIGVVRWGSRLEVLADSAIVMGVLFAFSFDDVSQLWALMVLPAMEAAWREQLRGALVTWAGLAVGYAIRHYWAAFAYEHVEAFIDSVTYRTSLVLTVTLAAGLLSRSMHQATAGHVAADAELHWRATTDPLTGTANREHFVDQLTADLDAGRPAAVAFFDIDDFKTVNDSLGHEAGDRLLASAAERLRGQLRDRDLLARFGGDEFTVLLRDVGQPALAKSVTQRLRGAFADPLDVDGRKVPTSACAGIAVSRHGTGSAHELVRNADLAMYEAKLRGRGCVAVHEPSMAQRWHRRMTLEHDVRRAVRDREVRVVYQPIVHADTGEVAGAEALLRWRHPVYGWLPPEEVVELASDVGVAVELGELVVDIALTDLARWRVDHPDMFVAVNLGSGQVRDAASTLNHLEDVMGLFDHPAQAIIVEVTESALLAEHDLELASLLTRVRDRGIRVAMDDFGRAHSSLARLQDLDLDIVKLDRGLLAKSVGNGATPVVLDSVVQLVHGLGLGVVAEGVESAAELRAVNEAGCDLAQGYLLGRPAPAAVLTKQLGRLAVSPEPSRSTLTLDVGGQATATDRP